MKRKIVIFSVTALSLGIAACQSTSLKSQAQSIIISPNPPDATCEFRGLVTGNQGNFVTGGFTPNKNLEQGAINDIRNKASKLGANYVQMISNRAGVTGRHGSQYQTNVIYTGNAYYCANSVRAK